MTFWTYHLYNLRSNYPKVLSKLMNKSIINNDK